MIFCRQAWKPQPPQEERSQSAFLKGKGEKKTKSTGKAEVASLLCEGTRQERDGFCAGAPLGPGARNPRAVNGKLASAGSFDEPRQLFDSH